MSFFKYSLTVAGLSKSEAGVLKSFLPKNVKPTFVDSDLSLCPPTALKARALAVFVETPVDERVISRFPNLEAVLAMSTGYDHVDLNTLKSRSIKLFNVPAYGEHTVAEHALALLLALNRKLIPAVERVRAGDFSYADLRGREISGKTIGVIGTGRIGRRFLELVSGFGVSALAYDQFPNLEIEQKGLARYVDLSELLRQSDFISLHLPLSKDTVHLLGAKEFKKIRPGAIIVNTARGGLIDSLALLTALNSGLVGGAALDVLEDELSLKHPEQYLYSEGKDALPHLRASAVNRALIEHERVLVTPHIAFNSDEAVGRILETTAANLRSFLVKRSQNEIKS